MFNLEEIMPKLIKFLFCTKRLLGIVGVFVVLVSNPVWAEDICPKHLDRPCVALVLGGGGARGGAHLGVIKALEEYGVPVDLVVGTSIGSLVGGLYASGKNAQQITELFENVDWNAGYKDALNRSNIPVRRKRQMDEFAIHLDVGVGAKGMKFPKGFIQGQSMKKLIDQMLGLKTTYASFDELAIPFRAVAADIETGEEVILADGDLATAMQVSMSLPGILRPFEHEGRLLVDGGIAKNLPVSVAKSMGAQVVIVVDIGSPVQTRDDLNSGLSVLRQLSSFLVKNNVDDQKKLLTENDILITPQMSDVTLLSFDQLKLAADAGYKSTVAALDAYQGRGIFNHKDHSIPEETNTDSLFIQKIVLDNNSRLGERFILNRMRLKEGQYYTKEQIQEGIDRLYGQGTISRVFTKIEALDDGYTLFITVDEKEWGPGYVDLKLEVEDDFHTFSHYQFGLAHRLTNLSRYGAELYTTFEVGTEKRFKSDLYWPIGSSGVFLNAVAEYDYTVFDYQVVEESYGNVVAKGAGGKLGLGWNSVDKFEVIVNSVYEDVTVDLPAFIKDETNLEKVSAIREGGQLVLSYDSLDDPNFSKRGIKLHGEFSKTKDSAFGIRQDNTQIDLALNYVFSVQRHSFRQQIKYQSVLERESNSILGSFQLGGFLNLSGNARNFISGKHVRFYSFVYSYELAENNFGAIRLPLYLGFSLEKGNAWANKDDVDLGDVVGSASVFVGWSSPIGPAYLAYGASDTGESSLYLFIGGTF